MPEIKIMNVSNPAAWAVEWIQPESGTTFQLYSLRWTSSLYMGMRPAGGTWTNAPVTDPSRFGMTGEVSTWKEFAAIADRFVNAD